MWKLSIGAKAYVLVKKKKKSAWGHIKKDWPDKMGASCIVRGWEPNGQGFSVKDNEFKSWSVPWPFLSSSRNTPLSTMCMTSLGREAQLA